MSSGWPSSGSQQNTLINSMHAPAGKLMPQHLSGVLSVTFTCSESQHTLHSWDPQVHSTRHPSFAKVHIRRPKQSDLYMLCGNAIAWVLSRNGCSTKEQTLLFGPWQGTMSASKNPSCGRPVWTQRPEGWGVPRPLPPRPPSPPLGRGQHQWRHAGPSGRGRGGGGGGRGGGQVGKAPLGGGPRPATGLPWHTQAGV